MFSGFLLDQSGPVACQLSFSAEFGTCPRVIRTGFRLELMSLSETVSFWGTIFHNIPREGNWIIKSDYFWMIAGAPVASIIAPKASCGQLEYFKSITKLSQHVGVWRVEWAKRKLAYRKIDLVEPLNLRPLHVLCRSSFGFCRGCRRCGIH